MCAQVGVHVYQDQWYGHIQFFFLLSEYSGKPTYYIPGLVGYSLDKQRLHGPAIDINSISDHYRL